MYEYLVDSTSSHKYRLKADRFEVKEGILYFYNEDDDLMAVIKDWTYFYIDDEDDDGDDPAPSNPDEFYELITKERSL